MIKKIISGCIIIFSFGINAQNTDTTANKTTVKIDSVEFIKHDKSGKHFVLFGHVEDIEGVKNHRLLHNQDSTRHHSLFAKYKDSLAYHKHHFKHLKKYYSGLLEVHIKNADLREIFDDIIKETGATFTYVGNIDVKSTLHIESFSVDQLVDEICYQSGMIAVKEQNRYVIYGYGAKNIIKDDKIIYHYLPRNIGAEAIKKKTSELNIKADLTLLDEQNLLLISGSLEQVKDAIYKLRLIDIEPKIVAIELLIVEYNHGNNFKWGFDITEGKLGRVDNFNYQANSSVGFTYNFLGQLLPTFKFNLQALIENNYANIVTNPHITSLNNKEAVLQIKESRYIMLQSATINGVTNNFEQISTGITLHITPIIMTNDAIHLSVDIDNSVFLPTETQGNVNTFGNSLSTKVIARNGETLIIGGMIKENESNGNGGLPFISKIPFIGLLFKNISKERQYIETVVYVTPYIDPLKIKEYIKASKDGNKLQKELDKKAIKMQKKGNRKLK